MQRHLFILSILPILLLTACGPSKNEDTLKSALTFHASFDTGEDADFAKGDGTMYTMVMTRPEPVFEPGLPGEVVMDSDGRFGSCLFFNTPEEIKGTRAFFKLKENLPYTKKNWQGSVSFWIRVTPDEDLRPGYTDPIQLTPRSALDGCLWVDFSLDEHRQFRMGAFPDKEYWNPEGKPNNEIPDEKRPLIPLVDPPFSRDHWSHVVMTFEGFNNSGTEGVAKLFINGRFHGETSGWKQIYSWDLDTAQIRLGVNFVGALDELSCFNRALNANEVAALYDLENGVSGLLE
ncbi:MAG: hypothetical protein KJT03_13615 [Verrucomicrobiae bacterium]|nr:hypothetical protein [Verrucomicrobiae bacterium]